MRCYVGEADEILLSYGSAVSGGDCLYEGPEVLAAVAQPGCVAERAEAGGTNEAGRSDLPGWTVLAGAIEMEVERDEDEVHVYGGSRGRCSRDIIATSPNL